MPLLGLGSDQVKKASREEKGIYAYHCDEFRGPDGTLLRSKYMNMSDADFDETSNILFMSPQSLSDHVDKTTGATRPSIWLTFLRRMAERG